MSLNQTKQPTVRILAEVRQETQQLRSGQTKPVFRQLVEVEGESLRMRTDIEVDDLKAGYPVGSVHDWDIYADIVAGQYQKVELARRWTLRPRSTKAAA